MMTMSEHRMQMEKLERINERGADVAQAAHPTAGSDYDADDVHLECPHCDGPINLHGHPLIQNPASRILRMGNISVFVKIGEVEENVWDEPPILLEEYGGKDVEKVVLQDSGLFHIVHPTAIADTYSRLQELEDRE